MPDLLLMHNEKTAEYIRRGYNNEVYICNLDFNNQLEISIIEKLEKKYKDIELVIF